MSYGDYGGYAWLDGRFMPENCDTVYAGNDYHVVLGAGSAKVGMRKQSATDIYLDGFLFDVPALNDFYGLVESEQIVQADVGTDKSVAELSVAYRYEDNYYQYVELRGRGGIWHGFSGYGVGNGLEYCGYGYSTLVRIAELESLFGVELERPRV